MVTAVANISPYEKKPVKRSVFFVAVANNSPNKRNLSKDIVCLLSLLPTFHPTTKIHIKGYCVVFVAVANISPNKQTKKTVKEYHMVFVIGANIAPNTRNLSKDIIWF